ncbi:epoxyqueuosine reductase [Vallitalea pronyensis]|uniref:Epoxyqueuosine reductase n=1 Tax=Vallitalea pronyensis TaxID=1348613 RepID=A0A8J8MJ05_9FIRM|nr:4Fe-4S binding protein [Vallitalea pronyensis]QUI22560.1 epoxyqueuosine reductase [Vallitalea pronyensis]
MKPPKMPTLNPDDIKNLEVIPAGKDARMGLSVPEIVMTYGGLKGMPSRKSLSKTTMAKLMYEMKKSYTSITKNPKNYKTTMDDATLQELQTYIRKYPIDDIGFTTVDPNLIFKDRVILHQHAIVLIMEMKKNKIDTAPSPDAQREIMRTYYELGRVANKICDFLRKRGYSAQAGPALGGDVNYPRLAEKAGLGAIGKHGLLIHPVYGPSLRIGAVYTSIENLPITDENEHLWLQSFCSTCKQCVKKCPANAIYNEDIIHPDGSRTATDYKLCAVPFAQQYGCTLCVKNCIFYKGDYHKLRSKLQCEHLT